MPNSTEKCDTRRMRGSDIVALAKMIEEHDFVDEYVYIETFRDQDEWGNLLCPDEYNFVEVDIVNSDGKYVNQFLWDEICWNFE